MRFSGLTEESAVGVRGLTLCRRLQLPTTDSCSPLLQCRRHVPPPRPDRPAPRSHARLQHVEQAGLRLDWRHRRRADREALLEGCAGQELGRGGPARRRHLRRRRPRPALWTAPPSCAICKARRCSISPSANVSSQTQRRRPDGHLHSAGAIGPGEPAIRRTLSVWQQLKKGWVMVAHSENKLPG